jgi:competence protein ComFB
VDFEQEKQDMNVHNVMEETVFTEIDRICESMRKEAALGNKQYDGICTCSQCRVDAACYVLNRITPSYIVSGRGVAHINKDTFERQQRMTDISILVYEAMLQVCHNRRPDFEHNSNDAKKKRERKQNEWFFNIPAVFGRILNGANFAPMMDIYVELLLDGKLVKMKDANWKNPCKLVGKTEGTYTFWPEALPAKTPGEAKVFNYKLQVEAPNFEPLFHSFMIPVESDANTDISFSMSRTFKLTDLYMFPSQD